MNINTLNKHDLVVPNFDHFIHSHLETATAEQLSRIPTALSARLFHGEKTRLDRLSFYEKLMILSVCFGNNIMIVSTLGENPINAKDLDRLLQAKKGEIKNSELLENFENKITYVVADRDLMNSLMYLNRLQNTDIYKLISHKKKHPVTKKAALFKENQKAMNEVVKMLVHYEGSKKSVVRNFQNYNLNLPKIFALMYYYDGEKTGKSFYEDVFRHSYQSNRGDLSKALSELFQEGYLDRRGGKKNLTYFITAKGIEFTDRIFNSLVFNYK